MITKLLLVLAGLILIVLPAYRFAQTEHPELFGCPSGQLYQSHITGAFWCNTPTNTTTAVSVQPSPACDGNYEVCSTVP